MKRTVLIVDDVEFVRKTLTEILSQAHYEVVGEAKDGREAVELFQKLSPDVVTMDIVMPEMSGIDATRRIIKMNKDAKIVMISAMGQENLVMEAINVGARDYLLKPFTADDVVKTVERVLTGQDRGTGRLRESRA
ncbi:MAG: response regulator [Bdellovibrionales bacterium]|nr:response regulator [Bdellovibrionales bacterium]